MTHSSAAVALFACAVFACAVVGPASSVPSPQREDGPGAAAGGYATVLWSVLDDCLGGDGASDPTVVCLKSKALTALDRALGKSTLTIADGLSLTARAGRSLPAEDLRADRAALDAAAGDSDRKNALLDDMLASRVDRLMSTRSIVLDGGEEGRGKKKDKAVQQAMMMAGMTAAAVMVPMAMKMIALMAGKALLISKIALVLSGLIALKKLFQPKGGHETESSQHHYGRSMQLDALDMAYSGQKQ